MSHLRAVAIDRLDGRSNIQFFGLENLQDRHVGQRPLQVVRRQSVGTDASVLWRANAVEGIRVGTGWQLLDPNRSYSCVPMHSMETVDVTPLHIETLNEIPGSAALLSRVWHRAVGVQPQ